jgi:Flp pilus assembly pilin Flp
MRREQSTRRGIARRQDHGATTAEYALIASLIAVVIVGAVALFGGAVAASFTDSGSQIESAVTQP